MTQLFYASAAPPSPASRHHHVKAVITGSVNSSELTLFDPLVVITGSVNSSELTLFDPVIHEKPTDFSVSIAG